MERLFTTRSAEETLDLGRRLAQTLSPGTCVALSGPLGAGKTTLAQGLLEGLGAQPPYTSPTFIIMKLYELARPAASGIRRVYHADAYRVEENDIVNAGLEEWLDDKEGLVLFEWPERAAGVLPGRRTDIVLTEGGSGERVIRLSE